MRRSKSADSVSVCVVSAATAVGRQRGSCSATAVSGCCAILTATRGTITFFVYTVPYSLLVERRRGQGGGGWRETS